MSIKILQSFMKKYSYLGQELDNKFDELKAYNKQKEDKQDC
ncbi:hypothetical protein [Paraclostridium sordellii]|nr:hypothetical protein [Paeniclostridium sordellii]CEN87318.1 Uncharacterised protein [[Clostridium] sordellii] [Paeniclostridium sordellii]